MHNTIKNQASSVQNYGIQSSQSDFLTIYNNTLENHYMDVYKNYIDDQHQILPIPEQEIGANSLVTQNPNW